MGEACLGKVVRDQPCDSLALDVCLVVKAFDRHKHLAQGVSPHHICLEFHGEPPCIGYHLGRDVVVGLRWQSCKEVGHGQRVIQISESVDKGWVPAEEDAGHRCLRHKVCICEQAAQMVVETNSDDVNCKRLRVPDILRQSHRSMQTTGTHMPTKECDESKLKGMQVCNLLCVGWVAKSKLHLSLTR